MKIDKIIEGKGVCTYFSHLLVCSALSISSILQVRSRSPCSTKLLSVADTIIKQLNSKKMNSILKIVGHNNIICAKPGLEQVNVYMHYYDNSNRGHLPHLC